MNIEFFWDVGSPYTYLAHTQLAEVADRMKASLRYRPMLIGGVFKATGNSMPAALPPKARYMATDLARWRDHYGVPMCVPAVEVVFPINTVLPMRIATWLTGQGRGADAADALLRAYWGEGRDVSELDVVKDVVKGLGFEPDAAVEAALEPANKDALRATTDEAVRRGAFGAPTFFVGDEMYWGHDRLALLEARHRSRV